MKRNNQPGVPKAKKPKKKAVNGFVWDEWGKYDAQLFGDVCHGQHEGKTIVNIFRRFDLSYNKYSKGIWNRHYKNIISRVLQYKTNMTGLENETFRKLVFGVAACQLQPMTTDSATAIAPATSAARKILRELESEDTLGSSGSTLFSDDETFLPNKRGGGAAAFWEEYSFDGNASEISSLRRSPFLEIRNIKEHDTPSPTKVLFKYPPS
jgi:hypothetical protein